MFKCWPIGVLLLVVGVVLFFFLGGVLSWEGRMCKEVEGVESEVGRDIQSAGVATIFTSIHSESSLLGPVLRFVCLSILKVDIPVRLPFLSCFFKP